MFYVLWWFLWILSITLFQGRFKRYMFISQRFFFLFNLGQCGFLIQTKNINFPLLQMSGLTQAEKHHESVIWSLYSNAKPQCCPLSVFPACQIHTYTVKHSQASLRWLFTHKGPDVAYETEETALRWVAAAFTAKGNHTRRYQKWKIWSCVM